MKRIGAASSPEHRNPALAWLWSAHKRRGPLPACSGGPSTARLVRSPLWNLWAGWPSWASQWSSTPGGILAAPSAAPAERTTRSGQVGAVRCASTAACGAAIRITSARLEAKHRRFGSGSLGGERLSRARPAQSGTWSGHAFGISVGYRRAVAMRRRALARLPARSVTAMRASMTPRARRARRSRTDRVWPARTAMRVEARRRPGTVTVARPKQSSLQRTRSIATPNASAVDAHARRQPVTQRRVPFGCERAVKTSGPREPRSWRVRLHGRFAQREKRPRAAISAGSRAIRYWRC